jgi:pimeloyl-ACP methyl ester carboxylesterase
MTAPAPRHLVMPDGTRIAYRVHGRGPAIVLSNGLTTDTVFWKHLVPVWSRSHSVVSWDLPGHGESGRPANEQATGIDAQARHVAALMDALGIERAVQIGWSTGCQIVCELLRAHEPRCSALVLLLGPAGHVLRTTSLPLRGGAIEAIARHAPPGAFALAFRALSQLARTPLADPLGRRMGLIGAGTAREDAAQVLRHIPTVEPAAVQGMLLSAARHDAHALLAGTQLPVLIVSGDVDPFAPAERVGVPLHRLAAGSELLRLPGGSHTALLDHAPVIAERVERFVAGVAVEGVAGSG